VDIRRSLLIIIIFFQFALIVSCKTQKESALDEMKQISGQMEKLDNVISGNINLISKLKMHESRLRTAKINPQIHRIPVLIEGRSVYTSAYELEIDDLAYSLALEDLLESHHSGKGKIESDDPSFWKKLLTEQSKEASSHISNVELPAIHKRILELDKENNSLESKKRKLFEKYRTLQNEV
jgi:hypothetical protein